MKNARKKILKSFTLGIILAFVFIASFAIASIPLGSNFQLNSQLPLDARTVVIDLTSRDAIPAGQRYEGLIVYVISTATNYQLQGGILNANWAVVGGVSGANALGTYITQTATNAPANAQVLGLLSTGIVKNTTTTGVLSIAVAGDFPTLNQNTTGSAASFTGSLVGEVTGTQGATVVGNSAVIGKILTGYTSGAGTVAATDTILQAVQKLNGNISPVIASGNANYFWATPNGVSGVPSLRAIVSTDIPTLNQNTTGTSANISGGLGGQILYQSAVNTTAKLANGTLGQVLVSGGTTVAPSWTDPVLTVVNTSNLFSTGLSGSGSGVTTTTDSIFLGPNAGLDATAASYSNFFGNSAGDSATSASNSNFMGVSSGALAEFASNSNFMGANSGTAAANASNSNFFGNQSGAGATNASNSNFFGANSGKSATAASYSNFLGVDAGNTATGATFSNFLGQNAGNGATGAHRSNFLGNFSGNLSTGAFQSNFMGTSAGRSATNSHDSNFFGTSSGYGGTSASYSNFFGFQTGKDATNAYDSNFFGQNAGNSAIDAANSVFIGNNSGFADTVVNTAAYDDITTFADTSILIGHKTSTGGNSNSIALGAYATNTAANQLMLGSSNRPINTTVWNGAGSVTCTFTTAVGAMTCASDINLKKKIFTLNNEPFILREDIDVLSLSTLNKILTLTPVTYNWNYEIDSDIPHMGFIAQEVEQVFPSLVLTNDTTHLKSLNVTGLTPYIVEAIKEMNLNIEGLNNLEVKNTWRDSLVAWFDNTTNGINRIYTKEICVKKSDGTDFCANGDQLEAMANNSSSPYSSGSSSGSGSEDESLPVITLSGEPIVTITVGDTYSDAGVTASSTIDGDITANVITVNPLDTSLAGTYTITYNVSDAAGKNAVEVTRTVIVNAPAPAV